jgi:hypothetical protein
MLSNGHHRSLLQTSKITEMLKQPTLGTLSPETTATTSSGYSTGGSSVSTSINPSLKKSSVSSSSTGGKQLLQQQQQQQQHKTKSKGKKNIIHVAKRPYLRSSYFDSASTDDIYYVFLIYTSCIYLSFYSPTNTEKKAQYITIVLICQHLPLVEILVLTSSFFLFIVNIDTFSCIPPTMMVFDDDKNVFFVILCFKDFSIFLLN